MKQIVTIILVFIIGQLGFSQSKITGKLLNSQKENIEFANIALFNQTDSTLTKVATTDIDGLFIFPNIANGIYQLKASYIGYIDYVQNDITVDQKDINLNNIIMTISAVELETAVIKARRALVEIKPDRTVFNVEGTINSTGDHALGLLRKAPGVLVDNNDNIIVLSRSGVLIYIDGKKLPLSGTELSSYMKNIPAEQIDRIDIITNPGAKYEAQGNAGIIDIRLKKDKSHGTNGTINSTVAMGEETSANLNLTGNYRNKKINLFVNGGFHDNNNKSTMLYLNHQNNIITDESNNWLTNDNGINYRVGADYFLHENHTLGLLISGDNTTGSNLSNNKLKLSQQLTPSKIDSVLVAKNSSENTRKNTTYNINYVFDNKKSSLNIDLDYGQYNYKEDYIQPNRYYDATESILYSEVLTAYKTPVSIDIYSGKVDFETTILGGKLGLGSKFSRVITDNTFLFYDIEASSNIQNDKRSNIFLYEENVMAEYISFSREINKKMSFSTGLRIETTDSKGDLTAFDASLNEPPVKSDYTNFFPSLGFTYRMAPMHVFALNYGRRINRPDYNVLNPFRVQISELSFSRGNAFLNPEIVNNIELGYTLKYRYNFKLSYSKTDNQITRLIGPDENDPRAGYVTWENLAKQEIINLNMSLPFSVKSWWDAYFNISLSHINNQADYGDGAIVDVQAISYNLFQQQSIKLGGGYIGEISGYYSGPGVWGGVFLFDPSWSLNLGLQKKFFDDKLNVKIAANDIFKKMGWSGTSSFDGLEGVGSGDWDSRRISFSISYNFGNKKVKSRKRKTGLEEEVKRLGKKT